MVKKILSYQKLLWLGSKLPRIKRGTGVLLFIFVMIFTLFSEIILGVDSMSAGFFPIIMLILGSTFASNTPLKRTVPVSDKFHVANILFVFPLLCAALIWVVLTCVFGGIGLLFHIPDITPIPEKFELYSHYIFSGTVFRILFIAGIWFLMVSAAFHRRKLTRYLYGSAIFACMLAFYAVLSLTLSHRGYHNNYSLVEIPEMFSPLWTICGAAVFAIGTGIFAWKRCLSLYRADLNGQGKQSEDQTAANLISNFSEQEAFTQNKKKDWVRTVLCFVPLILIITASSLFFRGLFGGGTPFSVESRTASDYAAWNILTQQVKMPDDLYYTESGLLTFPESVDEDTVQEYYAHFWGKYADGWSSCYSVRFLVLQLPQKQYIEEKERVSGLSLSHEGETNVMLHDVEHFAGDAYIAIFNSEMSNYEYVIFDDEKHQATYVFCEGDSAALGNIPTQRDFWVNTKVSPILLRQSNDDNGGYSIYSFWNEESGYYRKWWPGIKS